MHFEPLSPQKLMENVPGLESVEECFARGGFKCVYKAIVCGRQEALKVLSIKAIDEIDADPDVREAYLKEQFARIMREIEALSKCKVPEIVKLGKIIPVEFKLDDIYFLAYSEEFLEGTDLWSIIQTQGAKPELKELIRLFISLLRCIQDLWQHGYVHRDIKPQNLIKTNLPDRPFVLLDLGIAFAVYETSLTYNPSGRMPPATYRYIAPEMMQPDFRDRIDFRTDLYTTGMTVYEYASGKHPLAKDRDDIMQTISRALRQPPTPLGQYRRDLPIEFRELVDGLLKKKPALRPANLKVMIRTLEAMI
jgi:serine/threonine protein kinase